MRHSRSNRIMRVLVVPWSIAATYSPTAAPYAAGRRSVRDATWTLVLSHVSCRAGASREPAIGPQPSTGGLAGAGGRLGLLAGAAQRGGNAGSAEPRRRDRRPPPFSRHGHGAGRIAAAGSSAERGRPAALPRRRLPQHRRPRP